MVAEEIFFGWPEQKTTKNSFFKFYFLNKKCHFGFFVYLEILKKISLCVWV